MDNVINHNNGDPHDNNISNLSHAFMFTDKENINRRIFPQMVIEQELDKLHRDIIHGKIKIVDRDEKYRILDHAPLYINDYIKEDDGKELDSCDTL